MELHQLKIQQKQIHIYFASQTLPSPSRIHKNGGSALRFTKLVEHPLRIRENYSPLPLVTQVMVHLFSRLPHHATRCRRPHAAFDGPQPSRHPQTTMQALAACVTPAPSCPCNPHDALGRLCAASSRRRGAIGWRHTAPWPATPCPAVRAPHYYRIDF